MMLIHCPWCGDRDHTEFTYLGDAGLVWPVAPQATHDWLEYVYLRDNPKGRHVEYWHHHAGCRQWLKVARNTVTHTITATAPADGPLAP